MMTTKNNITPKAGGQQPTTKLLINHGKPNYTINRAPKLNGTNGSITTHTRPTRPLAQTYSLPSKTTHLNGSKSITTPTELNKVVLKHTQQQKHSENGQPEPEFLQARRKINEKHELEVSNGLIQASATAKTAQAPQIERGTIQSNVIKRVDSRNGEVEQSLPKPVMSTKLITSFSKDLSTELNKYPEQVRTTRTVPNETESDVLQELAKLKFDIKSDKEDITITPMIVQNFN